MLDGTYNPGQLKAIREILYATDTSGASHSPGAPFVDFDTAKFQGNLADYTITTVNGVTTVVDNVAARDGTDHLMHVERLQFTDQAIVLGGLDSKPVGTLTLSGIPTEGTPVTVSIAGVTDADNVSAINPDGHIPPPVAYFWQVDLRGDGTFTDITRFAAGEVARQEGLTFTPTDAEAGLALRVRAVYQDALGVLEEVYSTPEVVANVNDAPVGTVLISDTTPTETLTLTAVNAFTDADGLTAAVFTYQWQRLTIGADPAIDANWTNVGTASTVPQFTPTQAEVGHQLRVVVSYTDDLGTAETVTSAPTGIIAANAASQTLNGTAGDDLIFGGGGNDTLIGLAGSDTLDGGTGNDSLVGGDGNDSLVGGAGVDTLNGGNGDDTLAGGAGNDVINAGTGSDIINYTIGEGADAVVGGTGPGVGPANTDLDTLNIIGTAGSDTLAVVFNGTVLTGVAGGTVAEIERVNADLLGGSDALSYGTGTTAAVSVNLATHSASGFTAIAGIENVTGGSGADTLIGDGGANALTGGAGNDTLSGGLGADVLTGAGGTDTASYAGETDAMFIDLATGSARRGAAVNPVEDTLISIENVSGGSGSDGIAGNAAANRLEGGDGNDTLVGAAGNDTLLGQAGNDTFSYSSGDGNDALVDGGDGVDTLSILGNVGANTLTVTYDGSVITSIAGTVASLLNVEHVTADLAGGTDVLSYGATSANVSVNLGANTASGFSAISGQAISNIENVVGGSGADTLTGDGLANSLGGGGGNDTLTGGGGNDTVTGDAGNDTFVATSNDGNDSYNGGAGIDTLDLHLINLGATITTTTAIGAEIGIDTLSNIENVIGTQGNDSISLNGNANVIDGQGGADIINAGGSNDVIIGGLGNDTMTGGTGNDIFQFAAGYGNDVITDFDANPGGGQDVLDITGYVPATGPDLFINSGTFASHVSIQVVAGNTVVTIDGSDSITLNGVTGVGANSVTIADFLLHA
jgi:Ca2+-binding RTX toxin-like protein